MSARALFPPQSVRPVLSHFFSTTTAARTHNASSSPPSSSPPSSSPPSSSSSSSSSSSDSHPQPDPNPTPSPAPKSEAINSPITAPSQKPKPKRLLLPKKFSLRSPRRSALKSVEEIDIFLKELDQIGPEPPHTGDEGAAATTSDGADGTGEEEVTRWKPRPVESRRSGRVPPPPPMVSPLADSDVKKTYSERNPKTAEQQPFTPQQVALRNNPFAHLLISPVRQDAQNMIRLPTSHMLRFSLKKHPENDDFYFLPWDPHRGFPRNQGLGSYTLLSQSLIKQVSGKAGKRHITKLIPPARRDDFSKATVKWRWDMDDVIRGRMADLVVHKLDKTAFRWGRDLEVLGEKLAEAGEDKVPVGVLDWRTREVLEEEALRECEEDEWQEEWGKTVDTVEGRVVPRYEMRRLVGEEKVELIKGLWESRGWWKGERIVLWSTQNTRGLGIELQRLRIYLDIYQRPVEEVEEEGDE